MKKAKFENEEVVKSTDFKAKSDAIFDELLQTVFFGITDENQGTTARKNQIKPTCTVTKVACKLDEVFFMFEPIEKPESVEPQEYIVAFREFMRLMTRINDYVIMTANKQLFCGFVGITVDDYNNLISQAFYSNVFKRIDDRLISSNMVSAESGLLESQVVVGKLQTKGAGHSLKKAEESNTFIAVNNIDKTAIQAELEKYKGLLLGK